MQGMLKFISFLYFFGKKSLSENICKCLLYSIKLYFRLPQEKQDSKPNSGCNVIDEASSNDDFQPSPDDDTFWADSVQWKI